MKGLSFASRKEQGKVQQRLLQEHVRHCLLHSPYYQKRLGTGRKVKSWALTDLPVTTKSDFSLHNDDFLAVPPNRIADIVQSSGTTGQPTRVAYTKKDLQRLARNEELALSASGIRRGDVALLTCTMDRCFIAGLAYYLGLQKIGAAVIRAGHSPLGGLADMIRRWKPSVIIGVPSFLYKLGGALEQMNMSPATAGVRLMAAIGEPLRDKDLKPLPVAARIEQMWATHIHSTYASSETVTSFCECEEQRGGHLIPELAFVEILDEQDRPLPPGEIGEVTLTPLGAEAMPLLRFKTGDISFLLDEPCSCGRTAPRLGPILGRKSQMLKFKGTTLYPPAIFAALDEIEGIQEYCVEVRTVEKGCDGIVIHTSFHGKADGVEAIREQLRARLRAVPEVIRETPETMRAMVYPPDSRKPVRWMDRRYDKSLS
jgi:phenylacetate-CoA ligase